MPLDLFVRCSNPECRLPEGQIWLRVAKHEQTVLDPTAWPNDRLPLYLACPECNFVSEHFGAAQGLPPEDTQSISRSGKVWLRVSFLCGEGGCETPAEFHVLMQAPRGQKTPDGIADESLKRRVLRLLQANHWTGYLPCHHELGYVPDKFYRFRWMQILRGYDQFDPRWDEMRSIK